MVRPQQLNLVAVKAGDIALGLCAAPAYIERYGAPKRIDDMAVHRMIGFDRETPFLRDFLRGQSLPPREAFAYRTDSGPASIGAIRSGFAIGLCQVGLARREGWTHLLPDAVTLSLETWIVMHEDLKANPACRVTFDALAEGIRSYAASGSVEPFASL
jgi:DNA-binding transcriptional LysR family regulator